ncbi:hypothetical protein M3Y98_00270800 [Aphelenchoides besseyi]|nr:hypothetical protein M3Y98_00270800 [Aphelenchoides besseyi]KAI6200946.1 hypothetical protein M3Y96_00788800 [Aphelenchoides besseyi]
MQRWLLFVVCLQLVAARPSTDEKTETISEQDINCPISRVSYFSTIRVEPLTTAAHKADDVEEEKCNNWCTTNMNPNNKPFNCSSYTYNDETRRCKLYAQRTYPDGPLERRTTSKPKRFFEKYCLPESISKRCAKTEFMRVDEMLLSGFAQATATFQTLAECMTHCVEEKEFVCKSAMYFYEEGECITNLETINDNATLIHVEDDDRVIFVQNDCYLKEQEMKKQKEHGEISTTPKTTTQSTTERETTTTSTPRPTTTAEAKPIETTTLQEETTAMIKEKVEIMKPQKKIGDSKQIKEFKQPSDRKEKIDFNTGSQGSIDTRRIDLHITETPELDTGSSESSVVDGTAQLDTEEKVEDSTPKQQLYGAETLKTEDNLGIEHMVDSLDLLTTTEFSLLKTTKDTKPSNAIKEKNSLKEFHLSGPTNELRPVSEEGRFFSTWENWTPCSNIGERRVRRRKCLDTKKCRGSLMQLDYCPPELVLRNANEEQAEEDAFSHGPIGPVRQPLPVSVDASNEANGAPPAILPPQLPQKTREPLPDGAPAGRPEDVWSPWLGVCQHFVSSQPCKNNQVIGFESRECIAKDPQACKGPFFRYCTLAC